MTIFHALSISLTHAFLAFFKDQRTILHMTVTFKHFTRRLFCGSSWPSLCPFLSTFEGSRQPGRVEIDLVHGLSTSSPSAERTTQGRALPVGSFAGLSFRAQGSEDSRPS